MRKSNFICLALFMLFACKTKQETGSPPEMPVLNDAFMDIIGTVPYQYHSLRPAPDDSVYTDPETLNVAITPSLLSIRKWEKEIIASAGEANAEDRKRIIAMFEKSKSDSAQLPLPVDQLRKTGRYRLFPYTKHSVAIDTLSAIGKIEFTRTYFDDKYAIAVATIRDQIKNGIVKLLLFEKAGTTWRKKEEYILEIW